MPTTVILLLDAAFIAAAIELVAWIVGTFLFPGAEVGFQGVTVSASAGLLCGVGTSYLTGMHLPSLLRVRAEIASRSALVGASTALGILLASHFVWYQALGRSVLLLVAATSAIAVFGWRLAYARYIAHGPRVRLVVLGNGSIEQSLGSQIEGVGHTRYRVLGVLGDEDRSGIPSPVPVLGPLQDAVAVCRRHQIDGVLIVGSGDLDPERERALTDLRVHGFEIRTAEVLLMQLLRRVPTDMVDTRWLLNLFEQLDPDRDRVKRVLDLAIASLGLGLFAILLPILYPLVRLDSPGPFFYAQDRVGLGNRVFRVHKIRTMSVAAPDADQRWASSNDARTTRIGRFLRRSRLDEFPQFWNVLKGEMSIVGPRPEQPRIARELEQQIAFFDYRHLVKPGITGWAQIEHGYAGSLEESRLKLAYDLYYVRHHTLGLDLDIMLRTFFVMLARIGSR